MSEERAIRALIAQAYGWERQHVAARRRVEAMACAIRRAALEDALTIVTGGPHRPGSPQIPARGRVPPPLYP